MTTTKGFLPDARRWDVFALATAAPLGPFVHAHLAPKFPPDLLNTALATFLPLQDDELLLAIVESGGPKPVRCSALTTRRVYWTDWSDQVQSSGGPGQQSPGRSATRQLVVRIADYAHLPERLPVVDAADGSSGIDLGNGTVIALGRGEAALASAVARYLETMGSAARAGDVPDGVIDPDLASRAARALPAVAGVTAQSRAYGQDLSQFRSSMESATDREFITPVFVGSCVLVYAAMVVKGVPWLFPTSQQLLNWGTNNGVRVALDREYWRLITSVFVHGGIIHLALNMWNLVVVGPLVERLYGNLAFAVIYLAAGVGGALASLATNPTRAGVGASGAILGILGALVAFLIVHRRAIPKSILKSFVNSFIFVVVSMVILGYFIPNIDHQAHLGGFVTGFVSGLLLTRPWPVVSSRWIVVRRFLAACLIVGALVGATAGVMRRAAATMPPEVRDQAANEKIAPSVMEFQAIMSEAPSPFILCRDFDNPQARASHLKIIKALSGRAVANLSALRRETTSDSRLRLRADSLIKAVSGQIAGLQAAERFLETGDLEGIPPWVRLEAMAEQIRPTLEKYDAINKAAPSTLVLRKDIDDPVARAAHLETTRALIGRASENLAAISRATTPDPVLKKMLKSRVEAQSSQLASLRAAERFLVTGDAENVKGSGGMVEALTAAWTAIESFEEQHLSFLRDNKLIRKDAAP